MPFFDWVLSATTRASLLTVAVFLAQSILRHYVSARWNYALWLPVLIVLLMPISLESSWSVTSITHMAPAPQQELSITEPSKAASVPLSFDAASETPVPVPWRQIICLAWLGGAIGIMSFSIVAFTQTLWRFRRTRLPVSDILQCELAGLAPQMGLHHVPRVWVASAIRSPAVIGLLRPTLLLPSHFEQMLQPHEARLVLKHELMHIKRGDLWVNALLCLLLSMHWFNPLLWLAFFKARFDREAACDTQVLDGANQTQRVTYGHTLLKVETAFSQQGLSLGFVGIFQRGAALRARIQSIANQPRAHPIMKIATSVSIVLLTFIGITKGASPDPKAPQIHIVSKFIELHSRGDAPVLVLPEPLHEGNIKPGFVGTFPDSQIQTLIRELSQRKGVDLLSAPTVTTKSGRKSQSRDHP
ncbi:M56 family metallopeptidase [Prosthecobacter fusiformis]|nr:M56 family metallopeptidase [Prosthecobacter fusiformis]